jgi:hypothetical protein
MMHTSIRGRVLLLGAGVLAGALAWGQQVQGQASQATGTLDVAVVYNAVRANLVGSDNFWMQGGSVQIHGQFWRGLGIVADIAGSHASNASGSGVGLDMVTATFGPRYTWSPEHHRYGFFGQVLIGEANGLNSVFPAPTGAIDSDHGLALYVGGGANVHLTRHLSVRALEVDWLRTQLPNSTNNAQNNLRLGSGLIFRFK